MLSEIQQNLEQRASSYLEDVKTEIPVDQNSSDTDFFYLKTIKEKEKTLA